MRVVICGGRQFADAAFLWKTIDEFHAKTPITEVIVGGAVGADTLGEHWAKDRRVPYRIFMADWATHGRAAGPIRNKAMLDEGKPDLVVAFPGGSGTANMLSQARAAGVKVWQPGLETVSEGQNGERLASDRAGLD
jgi:hypothetical protein